MNIPPIITDNPVPWLALIGAAITLATSFGLTLTAEQVKALGAFFAALWAIFGLWGHYVTVPRTPSATASPNSIQVPPPSPDVAP